MEYFAYAAVAVVAVTALVIWLYGYFADDDVGPGWDDEQ